MGENNSRLAEEVAKLDAEIRELEKQIGESEADIVSRVIFRVNDIIDKEIRLVDGN
jgi:peptidoglycan hydrolase CwlO-like protein